MSFADIIARVKARPELWQSSHPFFRNRYVSARTWLDIAEDLGSDDCNLIKKRWKHLKDTFRKEIKRVTSNQVTMSSWVHYNDLHFLTDEMIKKPDRKESAESESESETEVKPKRSSIQRRSDRSLARVDSKSQSAIKFKKILRSLNTLSKSIEKPNENEHFKKDDSDYMFLVSLLPTMQNMSDIQRLHFRSKINNWLLNALVENGYSEECDNKAYVQAQINDSNTLNE